MEGEIKYSTVKCELAPYFKSVKVNGLELILTVVLPMISNIKEFIELFYDYPVYINGKEFVRSHGYDMNQPIRITYTDSGYPIIVLVLYGYNTKLDITKELILKYPSGYKKLYSLEGLGN